MLVSSLPLTPLRLLFVCVVLTFFLLLLPAVLLLPLGHQGSRGQYHVGVGIPQSLTTEKRGVVTWETPAHMGPVLHTVEVHDWQTNRQQ